MAENRIGESDPRVVIVDGRDHALVDIDLVRLLLDLLYELPKHAQNIHMRPRGVAYEYAIDRLEELKNQF